MSDPSPKRRKTTPDDSLEIKDTPPPNKMITIEVDPSFSKTTCKYCPSMSDLLVLKACKTGNHDALGKLLTHGGGYKPSVRVGCGFEGSQELSDGINLILERDDDKSLDAILKAKFMMSENILIDAVQCDAIKCVGRLLAWLKNTIAPQHQKDSEEFIQEMICGAMRESMKWSFEMFKLFAEKVVITKSLSIDLFNRRMDLEKSRTLKTWMLKIGGSIVETHLFDSVSTHIKEKEAEIRRLSGNFGGFASETDDSEYDNTITFV